MYLDPGNCSYVVPMLLAALVDALFAIQLFGEGSRRSSGVFLASRASRNAYLLPGEGAGLLYDEITPVDTFRLVLNHYLGLDQPLLKDRSCFSTWTQPAKFLDVTDDVLTGRRPAAWDE